MNKEKIWKETNKEKWMERILMLKINANNHNGKEKWKNKQRYGNQVVGVVQRKRIKKYMKTKKLYECCVLEEKERKQVKKQNKEKKGESRKVFFFNRKWKRVNEWKKMMKEIFKKQRFGSK